MQTLSSTISMSILSQPVEVVVEGAVGRAVRFLLADNLSLDLPEDRVPHRVTREASRLVGEPKVIANSGGGSLTFVGE